MDIKAIIGSVKNDLKADKPKAIYFIGCGGSMSALYAAHYLINKESEIMTNIYTANEFVHSAPKALGEDCICVLCSLGATAETVEAIRTANNAGAITIAMSGSEETLTYKTGKYGVTYAKGANGNQATALKIAFEILKVFENYKYYDEAMAAYPLLDGIIEKGLKANEENAKRFANEFKDCECFYVLGSGTLHISAYIMACCHMMEMQWKHCIPLNSGEYFHGTFETTEKNVPVILFKSSGKTRPLDERVERFVPQYSDKFIAIDTKDFGMDAIDKNVAEYFESAVMFYIEREMVYQMSIARNHPMEKRRYMWQFEY